MDSRCARLAKFAVAGPHAAAAVRMLSLREPCRAGWQFNPALFVDAEAIEAFDAFRAGRTTSFRMTYPALQVARFDLLLAAWEDPRPEVQDAAVIAISGGAEGYGSNASEMERWQSFAAAQRQRAFASYDRDTAAIVAGTLATKSDAWRKGRLGSIGKLAAALRS